MLNKKINEKIRRNQYINLRIKQVKEKIKQEVLESS